MPAGFETHLMLASNIFFNPDLSPQQWQLAFEARCRKQQKKLETDSKSPSVSYWATESQTETLRCLPTLSSSQLPTTAIATDISDVSAMGADQHPSDSSSNTHQPHSEPELVTNNCRFQSK